MNFKLLSLALACIVAFSAAQTNSSIASNSTTPVIPYVPASLVDEIVSCPLRDQILRLNQLAAVEYLNRAFFVDLLNRFNALPSTASASSLGLPAGFTLPDVQSNLTLIVNQLNIVTSFFNSTIPSWCPQLTSDDQMNCYVFSPCSNYVFNNLSSSVWSPIPANSSSSSNSTVHGNSTSSLNGTHSGNSTASNGTSSSNNSTASALPSNSTVQTAVRQGVFFSNEVVNFIIGTVPLLSNSTLQLQLMEFEALHAQQASFLDVLGGSTPLTMPTIVSSSNSGMFNRVSIMSQLVQFISNPTCCDGWRNVRSA